MIKFKVIDNKLSQQYEKKYAVRRQFKQLSRRHKSRYEQLDDSLLNSTATDNQTKFADTNESLERSTESGKRSIDLDINVRNSLKQSAEQMRNQVETELECSNGQQVKSSAVFGCGKLLDKTTANTKAIVKPGLT